MALVGHVYTADDGRSWDLKTGVRTNRDGSTTPESQWSDDERRIADSWRERADEREWAEAVADGLEAVQLIRANAGADIPVAEDLQGQVEAFAANARARADAIAASTPAVNLAYVTALRDELERAARRDALLADAVNNILTWRQKSDVAIQVVCTPLIWVGRLISRRSQ